jgi:hypothetical protein
MNIGMGLKTLIMIKDCSRCTAIRTSYQPGVLNALKPYCRSFKALGNGMRAIGVFGAHAAPCQQMVRRDADTKYLLGQDVIDPFLKSGISCLAIERRLVFAKKTLVGESRKRTVLLAHRLAPSWSAAQASAGYPTCGPPTRVGVKTSSFERLAMQVNPIRVAAAQ